MDELKELKNRMSQERPQPWDAMPDIGLYMDQIISYMPRQLIHYGEGEGLLTSAMVNNYIKDGMLPRADGKRYSRTHLSYLTAICALKHVLSVRDAHVLIQSGTAGRDVEAIYAYFCNALDCALSETAQALDDTTAEEDLPKLALQLALRSYADQLACERILDVIAQKSAPVTPPEKAKKTTKKSPSKG